MTKTQTAPETQTATIANEVRTEVRAQVSCSLTACHTTHDADPALDDATIEAEALELGWTRHTITGDRVRHALRGRTTAWVCPEHRQTVRLGGNESGHHVRADRIAEVLGTSTDTVLDLARRSGHLGDPADLLARTSYPSTDGVKRSRTTHVRCARTGCEQEAYGFDGEAPEVVLAVEGTWVEVEPGTWWCGWCAGEIVAIPARGMGYRTRALAGALGLDADALVAEVREHRAQIEIDAERDADDEDGEED